MEENNNIPKIIHYFWFGNGEIPELFYKCLDSWKKFCPDFEIKRWDETNFDINMSTYTKEAYEQKKYAFVSDYARFYVVEKYGGIYLDIDVELVNSIEKLLEKESFCGFEYNSNLVNPGLILGSVPHGKFVSSVLDYYNSLGEFKFGTHTVCTISSEILSQNFSIDLSKYDEIQDVSNVTVYPAKYFCAYDQISKKIMRDKETISIHHYNASWLRPKDKFINFIKKIVYSILGKRNYEKLKKMLKK